MDAPWLRQTNGWCAFFFVHTVSPGGFVFCEPLHFLLEWEQYQWDMIYFFISGSSLWLQHCKMMGYTISCSREKYSLTMWSFKYYLKLNASILVPEANEQRPKIFCVSFGFPSLSKPHIVFEGLLCANACQLLTKWGYSVSLSTVNFNNLLAGPVTVSFYHIINNDSISLMPLHHKRWLPALFQFCNEVQWSGNWSTLDQIR